MASSFTIAPSGSARESNGIEQFPDAQQSALPPRKPPRSAADSESLLTAESVAKRLNVSTDWVWDHSSRKKPFLPVIRMGMERFATVRAPLKPSSMSVNG
jgi:hypothetical protein